MIYLILALLLLSEVSENWHIASTGGINLRSLSIPAAALIVVGTGLLFRRRSAALIATLGSFAVTLWVLVGSVLNVPMPWLLVMVALAGIALAPAFVILKNWRDLNGW